MTKMQKVWLWIFLAMFIVPEVLWSPVGNFIYIFIKGGNHPVIWRNNFLMQTDFRNLLTLVLFIQFVGLLLGSYALIKKKPKSYFEIFIIVLMLLVLLLNFFVLYLVWATRHIGT